MSQPDGGIVPRRRPLRVTSERLTDEEAERVRPTPSVTRFASHTAAASTDVTTARTTVLPSLPDVVPAPRPPAVSAGLPVVAPRPRGGRWSAIVRLVFARRRTGRHRPETMTTRSWSMFAPQRRRARRWGRY